MKNFLPLLMLFGSTSVFAISEPMGQGSVLEYGDSLQVTFRSHVLGRSALQVHAGQNSVTIESSHLLGVGPLTSACSVVMKETKNEIRTIGDVEPDYPETLNYNVSVMKAPGVVFKNWYILKFTDADTQIDRIQCGSNDDDVGLDKIASRISDYFLIRENNEVR